MLDICFAGQVVARRSAFLLVAFTVNTALPQSDSSLESSLPQNLATRTLGKDWPSFLGPRRDGKSLEEGILTNWPVEGPPIVWKTEMGTGYTACAISRGRCFVFDRIDDRLRLRCLNSENGTEIWNYTFPTTYSDLLGYDNGPRSSPVVDGPRVFVLGPQGKLHAVDVETGKKIWQVDTGSDFGVVPNFFGVGSTPLVVGNRLLLMVGGSPPESADLSPRHLDRVIPNGSAVVAFDKRTGEVLYRVGEALASYASLQATQVGDQTWGLAFCRGGLLAFDVDQGKVEFLFPWRAKRLESVNASTPVVVGERVFLSEAYGPGSCLLALRPGGQNVVWQDAPKSRKKKMMAHWATPVFHNGYLYGCSGQYRGNAELRCLHFSTGEVVWKHAGLARTSLTYVDNHLVCLSETGILRLIRATPSEYDSVAETDLRNEQGVKLLKEPAWTAPVISHGLLYVRGAGQLVCLELIPAYR